VHVVLLAERERIAARRERKETIPVRVKELLHCEYVGRGHRESGGVIPGHKREVAEKPRDTRHAVSADGTNSELEVGQLIAPGLAPSLDLRSIVQSHGADADPLTVRGNERVSMAVVPADQERSGSEGPPPELKPPRPGPGFIGTPNAVRDAAAPRIE
jgi:hypothetical protein